MDIFAKFSSKHYKLRTKLSDHIKIFGNVPRLMFRLGSLYHVIFFVKQDTSQPVRSVFVDVFN